MRRSLEDARITIAVQTSCNRSILFRVRPHDTSWVDVATLSIESTLEILMPLRFSLKMMMSLFVLMGVLGGYITSVTSRPHRFSITDVDISPDGKQLVCNGRNRIQQLDLASGKCRTLGTGISENYFFSSRKQNVRFVDDRTLAYVSITSFVSSNAELFLYSINDEEIVKQVELVPVMQAGRIQMEKTIVVYRDSSDSTKLSFYDLRTASRIPIRISPDIDDVHVITTSHDGRFAALFVTELGEPMIKIFETGTGNVTGTIEADHVLNLSLTADGARLLVIGNDSIRLIDYTAGTTIAEFQRSKATLPNATKLDVQLTDDGSRFLVHSRDGGNQIVRINSSDGSHDSIKVSSASALSKRDHTLYSADGSILYIPGKNTDSGFKIVNIESGATRSVGKFPRWLLVCLFVGLFIAWPLVWARQRRITDRCLDQDARDGTTNGESEASDPFADQPSDAAGVDTTDATQKLEGTGLEDEEIVIGRVLSNTSVLEKNAESTLSYVHGMMIAGGVIAIILAVVSSFFGSQSGLTPFFPAGMLGLIIVRTTFGLLTGIRAIAGGAGKSRQLLRSVAAFQVLNIINCDFFNGILGIVQTILLNQPGVRRHLDDTEILAAAERE